MKDTMQILFGLLGGLAVFIYGMNLMSESLQKAAGEKMKAILASIGQSKDAKRTAAAHCIFNISGSLVFIWFVKPYAALIQNLSTKGPEVDVISRQIVQMPTRALTWS